MPLFWTVLYCFLLCTFSKRSVYIVHTIGFDGNTPDLGRAGSLGVRDVALIAGVLVRHVPHLLLGVGLRLPARA